MINNSPETIRFRKISAGGDSNTRLIWFPHAGGTSASVVRQTIGRSLAMETWVAVLPGREERWQESATTLDSLVQEFNAAIKVSLDAEPNVSLIVAGHSFGGLLAYLLTVELCRNGNPPVALLPMAIAPPDQLEATSWNDASDHQLIEHLDKSYGAIPTALKNNPEALKQFLPVVRHDLRLMESYRHDHGLVQPLPVGIVACGGIDDRAIKQASLEQWSRFTQAEFQLKMYDGDHFFPYEHFEQITQLCGSLLA